MRVRVVSMGWVLLGAAAVVVGTYLALTNQGPKDFGWFAYTPLPDDVPVREIVLTTRLQIIGAAVCASGLIILASSVGYHLGRHRSRAS